MTNQKGGKKLKFVFRCDYCERQYKSWAAIERHLNKNIDHALLYYGLVNVYRRDVLNSNQEDLEEET